MLTINSVAVKSPKAFEVTINDFDGESERNAKGDLIRDRVTVKRTLKCEWGALTQAEISALLTAMGDIFFTVAYPDPILGTTTKTFYVGNRQSPVFRKKTDGSIIWENLSCTFIER